MPYSTFPNLARMERLLCWLGLHEWMIVYANPVTGVVRSRCFRCDTPRRALSDH
jgi:hypothetical protein